MNFRFFIPMCVLSLLLVFNCVSSFGVGSLSNPPFATHLARVLSGSKNATMKSATDLLTGSLIGFSLDEEDKKVVEQSSPRTVDRMEKDNPLTINDIIKLSQAGISDDSIIEYIHILKTPYTLTQPQIRRLQEAGVSQRVINYMTDTDRL